MSSVTVPKSAASSFEAAQAAPAKAGLLLPFCFFSVASAMTGAWIAFLGWLLWQLL